MLKDMLSHGTIQEVPKNIAKELETAREIVNRIMKKLKSNNQIEQGKGIIKVLN